MLVWCSAYRWCVSVIRCVLCRLWITRLGWFRPALIALKYRNRGRIYFNGKKSVPVSTGCVYMLHVRCEISRVLLITTTAWWDWCHHTGRQTCSESEGCTLRVISGLSLAIPRKPAHSFLKVATVMYFSWSSNSCSTHMFKKKHREYLFKHLLTSHLLTRNRTWFDSWFETELQLSWLYGV